MTDDSRIASILGEWIEKRDRGEKVDPEEVIATHPEFADELRRRFRALSLMEDALSDESGSPRLFPMREGRYGDFKVTGEGGMGIVYWALDTDLNRQVAFKIVRPQLGGERETPSVPIGLSPPDADTPASQAFETLKARFLQEAWVTAGLEHPGIVPVYELGETPEGVPYYTMRFVRGSRTLATAIEEAKEQPIEERLSLLEPFLRICDTIRYAHAHDVIHRDLKPENVAIGEFGEVVVLDWGLAKLKGEDDTAAETWQERLKEYREASDLRTRASAMGTPGYMAPEAALGRIDELDERCDVYSLGAILFEILTGRLPFEFETYLELVNKLVKEAPPAAAQIDATVPEDLSGICASALSREKEDRITGVAELSEAIRSWQRESAVEREIEGHLREAASAVAAAESLRGTDLLRQLDRATASINQAIRLRAEDRRAVEMRDKVEGLRKRGIRERESLVRKKVILRGGVAVALAAAVAAVFVVTALESRRRQADDLRRVAQERLSQSYVEQGRQELLADRPGRAWVYFAEAYAGGADGPAIRLLLAEAARRTGGGVEAFPTEGTPEGTLRVVRSLLPERAGIARALASLTGGQIAVSEDGNRYAAAVGGNQVRVHDIRDPDRVIELKGHRGKVTSVALSPDGSRVATGSEDHTGALWDAATGERMVVLGEHRYPVSRVSFCPDGSRVLTLEQDDSMEATYGAVRLWDASTGKVLTRISPSELAKEVHFIGSAVLSPEGRWIATSPRSLDSAGAIWDARTGERVARLQDEKLYVVSVAWSPDGERIVLAGMEMTEDRRSECVVVVWSFEKREFERKMRGHSGIVISATFSPDGRRVVTPGLQDGTVRIWDADSGDLLETFRETGLNPIGASFADDGLHVVTIWADGVVRVWRTSVRTGSIRIDAKNGRFMPGGTRVLGREGTGRLGIWDVETGELLRSTETDDERNLDAEGPGIRHLPRVFSGAIEERGFASEGRIAWIRPKKGDVVFFFDAASGEMTKALSPLHGVRGFVPDPKGPRAVVVGRDRRARVLDLRTEEVLTVLEGAADAVAFAAGGDLLAVTRKHRSGRGLSVWDARTYELLFSCDPDAAVRAVFDAQGRHVLVLALDTVHATLRDARSGEVLTTLEDIAIANAAFSPDGAFMVTDSPGVVRLWQVPSGLLLMRFGTGDSAKFTRSEFSPDGSRLLISGDRIVLLDMSREERAPTEVAADLRDRVAWRLEEGRLVPVPRNEGGE